MLFFNRKKKIYSPCSGQVKALSNVDDAVFSKGLAGDGFAVIPDDSVVSSPVDGTVTMIFQPSTPSESPMLRDMIISFILVLIP